MLRLLTQLIRQLIQFHFNLSNSIIKSHHLFFIIIVGSMVALKME